MTGGGVYDGLDGIAGVQAETGGTYEGRCWSIGGGVYDGTRARTGGDAIAIGTGAGVYDGRCGIATCGGGTYEAPGVPTAIGAGT